MQPDDPGGRGLWDSSQHNPHASVSIVEHSRLLAWLMLCCIISGLALGMSVLTVVMTSTDYRELEREYRLLQLQTDNMKVALLAAGMDPAPHLKGEAP